MEAATPTWPAGKSSFTTRWTEVVARLDRAQAAAYFMLGETTGTSAGGKFQEGKFMRVPRPRRRQ